jgi:hypothetical protein
MQLRRSPQRWIWASLVIQVLGLTFDAVWRALLNPSFEARTFGQMVTKVGIALPAAFVGALLSAAGEAWHAYSHLQLSTRSGPIAETVAVLGFTVVVLALWLAERQRLLKLSAAERASLREGGII